MKIFVTLPKSTFSRITVTIMAKHVDMIVMAVSGEIHVGNELLNNSVYELPIAFPANALIVAMDSLPKKKAVANFARLYFIAASEIMIGSSGRSVAAVRQSIRKACLFIFEALDSRVARFCSLKCLLISGVTL